MLGLGVRVRLVQAYAPNVTETEEIYWFMSVEKSQKKSLKNVSFYAFKTVNIEKKHKTGTYY